MTSERMEADGRAANPDLTRMLGVWVMRGGEVAFVGSADGNDPMPLEGTRLLGFDWWKDDGEYLFGMDEEDDRDYHLTERIASLGDLRMAADVLMGKRLYAAAAVLYQLLGDEEKTEDAIGLQRAVIAAEKEKPF